MSKQVAVLATLLALPALLRAQSYLPDGKGKEILDSYCQECHGLDPVIRQSLSAVEWQKVIARMTQKGANLNKADVETLVEYLTAYFGPDSAAPKVDVNRATASELQKTLELQPTEAEALVRYRKSHGKFQGWSDLLKARLVKAEKLEAKKSSITF